jgi:hypothetical protein
MSRSRHQSRRHRGWHSYGEDGFFLTLGSLIVAGCHLLPRSPPSRSLSACLFAVTAFIGIQGLLSGTMTALGLVPRGPLHDLVEYLADYDGDRPVVLLVGSSFTQQGVDLDVLAETLGNSDRSIAVLPLAIGGLSHLARLIHDVGGYGLADVA